MERGITWQDFSDLLLRIRSEEQLSQAKLAAILGCDRTHIWRLEHARCHPSMVLLRAFARAFSLAPLDRQLIEQFAQMIEYHIETIDASDNRRFG